jgi:hypothetical protein
MAISLQKSSETQFDIYQKMSGGHPCDRDIKHRIYRYSTTNGDQWGWNGTRSGLVCTTVDYARDDAGWTWSGNWADYEDGTYTGLGKKWTEAGGTWEVDYAQHDLPANCAMVDIGFYTYAAIADGVAIQWLIGGAWIDSTEYDIVRVKNATHTTKYLNSAGGREVQYQRYAVPVGATAIKMIVHDGGHDRVVLAPSNDSTAVLKCYVPCNIGESGWSYQTSRLLQSESTSDDVAIIMGSTYVTGPAHGGYERNQVVSLSMDGGADLFGTLNIGDLVTGDSLSCIIASDVHNATSGNKGAELIREFTWHDDVMDQTHRWKKTSETEGLVSRIYVGMWSAGSEAGSYRNSVGSLASGVGRLWFWHGHNTDFGATTSAAFWGNQIKVLGGRTAHVVCDCSLHGKLLHSTSLKLYIIKPIAYINSSEVNTTTVWSKTYKFFGANAIDVLQDRETVYVDKAITLNQEFERLLARKTIKLNNVAITVPSGFTLHTSFLVSEKSDLGERVTHNETEDRIPPLINPQPGDWTGVVLSGGNIYNCLIQHAASGVDNTSGTGNAKNNIVTTSTVGIKQTDGTLNHESNILFENASDYSGVTAGDNEQSVNPLWVNRYTNNFHLATRSPCVGSGVDVGLTVDFAGDPLNASPDIGPYKFTPAYRGRRIEPWMGRRSFVSGIIESAG